MIALLQENAGYAQFYESGTEPASVRWQQINTGHFRVIFPTGAGREGQRAVNVLEYIYKAEGKTLNHYPEKISVVLHNSTVISNGFVSWAPKRSEWYLMPPQDNYAQNWLDQLAIHEYRHVVQIDKLNRSFTRVLGFLVGQQGVGGVSGLVPKWFLEGDAVAAETSLTNAGRGRNPAFEMPLRTIALSGKYHKYEKAFFGSYRDHVPNHYELGYQMVGWTRERYGPGLYGTTLNTVAREPYLFFLYPFRLGLKRGTGYNTASELYRQAFDDLTLRWSRQEARTGFDSTSPVTRRTSGMYTSYRSPQYLDNSAFVAQKTGMAQIAQWVKVDRNGNEQVLHQPGFLNSERISYSRNLLVWTELVQDVRWTNRSYSIVKLLDLRTGKERTVRRNTRFFAPSLSPDGSTIAVVEVPAEGENTIVLLDTATGKEKNRLTAPAGAHLLTPSWSRDGTFLLLIVNSKAGKSVAKLNIASGLYTTVLPATFDDISHPVDGGHYLLFTGYYNGITNIYAADYLSGKISQVTSSRFGAFDPQPDSTGNKLVYAEYSVKGYNLVETDLNAAGWTPVEKITDHSLKLYGALARQEGFNMQDSIIPDVQHAVKPYRKWANLFNIHSWAPLYYEVDVSDVASTELYPGLVLLSQDLLGNLTSSAGYSWRGYNAFHAAFTYKGLYPVIEFKVDHGGRKAVLGLPGDEQDTFRPEKQNTAISVRSYIPFVLTRNRYITGIVPQAKLAFNSTYLYSDAAQSYKHGLWETDYGLQVYRYLKTSMRDIAPRLGIVAHGVFHHAPANTEHLGHIWYVYGRAYLPGIMRHHSLQLSGSRQQQKPGHYLFGTLLNFPRGYNNGRTEKLGIATIDYAFPVLYPDWNWGFLIYLKRLRTNLFCDVAENRYRILDRTTGQNRWLTDNMFSTGIDLIGDVNLLCINFPVNLGIRTVYVPETGKVQASLLFNVTFN